MRILFLASQFPYPKRSGATIKTAAILEHLQERHEVHVLCLRDAELDVEQSQIAERFAGFGSVEVRRGRNALNLARSYVSRLPLSVERNRSGEMAALVEERLAAERFDAVFIDGWLMAQYVPESFAGLRLLHEHNAEYVMWERQARLEGNLLRKPLVKAEASRVRRYESRIVQEFDAVFAVSEADRRTLIGLGADEGRVHVLPNVPDGTLLDAPPLSFEGSEALVLYLGTLSWQPNLEGIGRFLDEVWPLVRRQRSDARLLIAGGGAPRWLRRKAGSGKGVELAGEVLDAEPLYRRARAFIEATRSGGGTKVKILNALARGLPVAASPEAIEGLDVTPGEHVLAADRPPAMAAAVVQLLTDRATWDRLSEAGRRLMQERYTPEAAFGALDGTLSEERAAV